MTTIVYRPIGLLRTAFTAVEGMPIQPFSDNAADGTAEIDAEFAAGLAGLEGFSHVILLYHLHRQQRVQLTVAPFVDPQPRGVFATRAPSRPNPIGMSVVPLLRIDGRTLHLARLDMLDRTPLLDVKPYISRCDRIDAALDGWFGRACQVESVQADGRFQRPAPAVGALDPAPDPAPDPVADRT